MCVFPLVIDRLEFGCGDGGGGVARHARCQLHYVLHCPPIGNWVGREVGHLGKALESRTCSAWTRRGRQ
eukprot:6248706-Pyramimonas_sp.AAC.1